MMLQTIPVPRGHRNMTTTAAGPATPTTYLCRHLPQASASTASSSAADAGLRPPSKAHASVRRVCAVLCGGTDACRTARARQALGGKMSGLARHTPRSAQGASRSARSTKRWVYSCSDTAFPRVDGTGRVAAHCPSLMKVAPARLTLHTSRPSHITRPAPPQPATAVSKCFAGRRQPGSLR